MNDFKRQMQQMDSYLKNFAESYKGRMEQVEETLKTFGTQMLNIEKMSGENRRRIIEMEKASPQLREKGDSSKEQVRVFSVLKVNK